MDVDGVNAYGKQVISVDPLYIDNITVYHCIHLYTYISAALITSTHGGFCLSHNCTTEYCRTSVMNMCAGSTLLCAVSELLITKQMVESTNSK